MSSQYCKKHLYDFMRLFILISSLQALLYMVQTIELSLTLSLAL